MNANDFSVRSDRVTSSFQTPPLLEIIFRFPILLVHFLHPGNQPTSSLCRNGEEFDPLNYRSIEITSILSKTMETIISKHSLTFMEANNHLSDHQYGFGKARSTGDLLAYAVDIWSSTLKWSRVISLDRNTFMRLSISRGVHC